MIRQARSYLAGAMSATALVSLAVVAFVVLVSLQALRDWPLAGLATGADEGTAVSAARPAPGNATQPGTAGAGSASVKATAPSPNGGGAGPPEETGAEEAHAATPVVNEPSGGGSDPSPGSGPSGSAQPSASTAPSGGPQTPPKAVSPPPAGAAVENTVSGVGQAVNETVSGTTEAVEGTVGGAGDSSSPIGRVTTQVTEVTDALLGGDR